MSANAMTDVVTDDLIEAETAMKVGATAGGFLAAGATQSLAEGNMPFDVPNELYGLLVAYLAFYVDMEYSEEIAIGGGMMALDAAAQRFGIQESVTGV